MEDVEPCSEKMTNKDSRKYNLFKTKQKLKIIMKVERIKIERIKINKFTLKFGNYYQEIMQYNENR